MIKSNLAQSSQESVNSIVDLSPVLTQNDDYQHVVGIVLADSHPVTLKGIEQILTEEPNLKILDSCVDSESTLDALNEHKPSLLLLDLDLAGKNGLNILAEIARKNLPVKVVIFAVAMDDEQTFEAIRLGVRGVLLKTMDTSLILQCLRKVVQGGEWLERHLVTSALEKTLRQQATFEKLNKLLTQREIELALLVGKGFCNKLAARQLSVSEGSIKVYLNRIYSKLGINNRVELTLFLKKHGLI